MAVESGIQEVRVRKYILVINRLYQASLGTEQGEGQPRSLGASSPRTFDPPSSHPSNQKPVIHFTSDVLIK